MGNNPPQMTEHRGWEPSADYHEHWMDDPEWDVAEDQSESGSSVILVLGTIVLFGLAIWWLAGEHIVHQIRVWTSDEPQPQSSSLFNLQAGQCLTPAADGKWLVTNDSKICGTTGTTIKESPKAHGTTRPN